MPNSNASVTNGDPLMMFLGEILTANFHKFRLGAIEEFTGGIFLHAPGSHFLAAQDPSTFTLTFRETERDPERVIAHCSIGARRIILYGKAKPEEMGRCWSLIPYLASVFDIMGWKYRFVNVPLSSEGDQAFLTGADRMPAGSATIFL